MPQLSRSRLEKIKASVELAGRLSDSLVRFGPFSLGLDGVLSWIPGLGEAYSAIAGGFILVQGARAEVPPLTLLTCAGLMAGRTVFTAIPGIGPAFADVFVAHRWSARLISRAIERKLQGLGEGEVLDASWTVKPA